MVEDDEGHATLIRRNLQRARLNAEVAWARGGGEALEMIRREPGRRSVVLLDIRMPGMDGTEVLRLLKSDPATRTIPVFMLSTTDDPREVARCFDLGCNGYLTKPVDYPAFVETLQRFCGFLEVARFPGSPDVHHAPA
jgi:CheY-like chemotaxis protein